VPGVAGHFQVPGLGTFPRAGAAGLASARPGISRHASPDARARPGRAACRDGPGERRAGKDRRRPVMFVPGCPNAGPANPPAALWTACGACGCLAGASRAAFTGFGAALAALPALAASLLCQQDPAARLIITTAATWAVTGARSLAAEATPIRRALHAGDRTVPAGCCRPCAAATRRTWT